MKGDTERGGATTWKGPALCPRGAMGPLQLRDEGGRTPGRLCAPPVSGVLGGRLLITPTIVDSSPPSHGDFCSFFKNLLYVMGSLSIC